MFTFFDHTGDVGIDIRAASIEELFVEAAGAFVETVADRWAVRAGDALAIDLASGAPDLLLADWLGELLFRFETEGFLAASAAVEIRETGGAWHLRARVGGERGAAARLPIKVLVKAVTYHGLVVEPCGDGWRARVILDI